MAEPAIIAFILVATVGGIAAILGISADWELSHELSKATERWAAPVVVRRYDGSEASRARAAKETHILAEHRYRISGPGYPAAPAPAERVVVTFVLADSE